MLNEDDPSNRLDDNGRVLLQNNAMSLLGNAKMAGRNKLCK